MAESEMNQRYVWLSENNSESVPFHSFYPNIIQSS